jgi:hypothetical protein
MTAKHNRHGLLINRLSLPEIDGSLVGSLALNAVLRALKSRFRRTKIAVVAAEKVVVRKFNACRKGLQSKNSFHGDFPPIFI